MPMKRMLDESRNVDPKMAAALLVAFDGVVAELDLRTNADDRERAAKIIIRLALGQENLGDAAKLRDRAVAAVRKESGARRRPF